MSLALTDLLIELSDPARLQLYRGDPESFMQQFPNLTEDDKSALRSGRPSTIRFHATAVDAEEDPNTSYRQFTSSRAASFNPALIEIDPMVHVDITANSQTAISGKRQLFVDDRGRYFAGLAD